MLGIDPIFEGEVDMVTATSRLSSAMHAIITVKLPVLQGFVFLTWF